MTRDLCTELTISDTLIPYLQAVTAMEQRVANIIAHNANEWLWFVEHPPLYTAGTSANANDLIDPERFEVFKTGRGGEYTYHGPGQRVAYVMLDLAKRNAKDIRSYVYQLEQWLINTLARFAIKGERRQGRVGIWVDMGYSKEAKIAAIGVRVRKWVTFHGVALNVEPDLTHFGGIVPCGIHQHGVTSLFDLGHMVTMEEVDAVLIDEFENMFGCIVVT